MHYFILKHILTKKIINKSIFLMYIVYNLHNVLCIKNQHSQKNNHMKLQLIRIINFSSLLFVSF